ncbi:hypothetical protein PoB_006292600 [Plakobranchus ocellatus]|uniref:Uncharacterized protein n=1 Tax=Plakobranchus ocellatus TaxID=259542 RepID=A0AAV4CXH3_9GAST|nr:hypothetical protein PoB_006292600 [Plakobranchus ocellatus]
MSQIKSATRALRSEQPDAVRVLTPGSVFCSCRACWAARALLREQYVRKAQPENRERMRDGMVWFLYITSPQKRDFRPSGPPSGQGAGGGARIHDIRVLANLRAVFLSTVPVTPP